MIGLARDESCFDGVVCFHSSQLNFVEYLTGFVIGRTNPKLDVKIVSFEIPSESLSTALVELEGFLVKSKLYLRKTPDSSTSKLSLSFEPFFTVTVWYDEVLL